MEDQNLIDRYLNGDEEGFAMLVKKYQNQVINIVYSLTDRLQHADDIAQEIFIKVYQNLANFKKKSEFSTWIYRITVNTTYNYLKKEKRFAHSEHVDATESFEKKAVEVLEQKEKQELVRRALKRLPFKFRSAIVLKEIEGLSYKEIAQALGYRLGTVESRLFRARQMLKEILSPIIEEVAEAKVEKQ